MGKTGTKKKKNGAFSSALKTVLAFWFVVATIVGVYFFSVFIRDYYREGIAGEKEESSVSENAAVLPDLLGRKWTETLRKNLAAGSRDFPLVPVVVYDPDSSSPDGVIVAQHPAAGAEALLDKDGVCRSFTVTVSGEKHDKKCKDFRGYTTEKLLLWLEECGVNRESVLLYYSVDKTVPLGKVISLTYSDRSNVPIGTLVTPDKSYALNISSVVNKTIVPSLVGLSEKDARAALSAARLNVGTVTVELSKAPTGQVLSQSIDHGETVECGTAVNIVISKEDNKLFALPSFTGLSKEEATAKALEYDLHIIFQTQENYLYNDNTVISQSIEKDSLVSAGASVTLIVATGGKADTSVNWADSMVSVSLSESTFLSRPTLLRIIAECTGKTVLIGIREKYMWQLPSGVNFKAAGDGIDMEVLFDEDCADYDEIIDQYRDLGISRRFVFSAPAAEYLNSGVRLELKLGGRFANKTLQLYHLDENGNFVAVEGSKIIADSLGYASFPINSTDSYAVVIIETN